MINSFPTFPATQQISFAYTIGFAAMLDQLDTNSPILRPSDNNAGLMSPCMHASPPEPAAASPELSCSPAGVAAVGLDLESPGDCHDRAPSCEEIADSEDEETVHESPSPGPWRLTPRTCLLPRTKQTSRLGQIPRVRVSTVTGARTTDRRQTPCAQCLDYLANHASPNDASPGLVAEACADDNKCALHSTCFLCCS